MTYITAKQADALAGTEWHNGKYADKAVLLANTWLQNRGVRPSESEALKQAAAMLVTMAAEGRLYADKQTGLLAESVQADSVSSSQSFSPDAEFVSGEMQMVEALIKPFLGLAGNPNVKMTARL